MQELHVQPTVELPLGPGHQPFLEVPAREDLRVLVPGAIEHPTPARTANAAHALEASREKVQLEAQGMRTHPLEPAAVEPLEPGVLVVHALERELKPEAR